MRCDSLISIYARSADVSAIVAASKAAYAATSVTRPSPEELEARNLGWERVPVTDEMEPVFRAWLNHNRTPTTATTAAATVIAAARSHPFRFP